MIPNAPEERLRRAATGQGESELIGSMLLDESAIDEASRTVRPEHFGNEVLRAVFETLLALRREDRPVSAEAVAAVMGEQPGLVDELVQCLDLVANALHADFYARQVQSDYQRRTFRQLMTDAGAELKRAELPVDEALHSHVRQVESLIDDESENDGHIAEHLLAADNFNELERFTTGLQDLDVLLDGGFAAGQLVCVGARPSVGKTALCSGLALAAATVGVETLFLSCEMNEQEITARISRQFGIRRNDADAESINALASFPLFVRDAAGWTIDHLECEARRYVRRYGVKLLFVDYLSLVRPRDPRLPRYEQVADISRSLKMLALKAGLTVVAAQQLSRDIEKRDNRRPRMSDFRESGSIEQDSDVLIAIDRPIRPDEGDRTEAHLFLMKHRNGETGNLKLKFEPQRTLFTEQDG